MFPKLPYAKDEDCMIQSVVFVVVVHDGRKG